LNTPTRSLILPIAALLTLAGSLVPASAQTPIDGSTVTPLVTGLQGPRGLVFGPDGNLYVAEAGTGGTNSTGTSCTQVPGPIGPYTGGATARISRIDRSGNRTTLATGLPSAANAVGDIEGTADVVFLDGELYALLEGGGCSHGNPTLPNGIVKVNTNSGNWKYITDLSVFFAEHPAAYPDAGDFEADGTPYSMIAYQGNLFSIEANHGQLVRTTPRGANTLVADISAHLGHIVPTGLAEANGNLYVTNLGQFPITPDWEKLMTFSHDSLFIDHTPGLWENPSDLGKFKLAAVRAGLSGAVSLKFGPDGLLYVLELSTAAAFPTPGTGKVLRLSRDGTFEDVVTGLTVPTGMTFGPDQALYICNFGAAPAGAGQILRVFIPM
jgi:sugar lactone lactonase YvrE